MDNKKKKVLSRRLIVVLFLIVFSIISVVSIRGDYLEIKEIGDVYLSVFYTNLLNKFVISVLTFFICYILTYLSNKRLCNGLKEFFDKDKKEMPKLPNKSISFISSIIFSMISQGFLTEKFLMFANSSQFGINDPVFNMDVSFYLFKLPFIKTFLLFVIGYIIILTIYSAVYYIVTLNVYLDGVDRETLTKNGFIKEIIRNVILIAILISGIVLLSTFEIESGTMITLSDEQRTEIIGAGLTDVKIKVLGYRILAIMILISVFRVIKYLKKFKVKKIINSMLIVPIYLVALFVVMTGFQYVYAERNELDKQKKYLNYNLDYTRLAYNINVDEIQLENSDDTEKIVTGSTVLKDATVVNKKATLASLSEFKDSEGYYTYQNSQIGIYDVNGIKTPVYITPREIVSGANRTYSSNTYQYTHGYGVVVSSVSEVDEKGNAKFIQSDYNEEDDILNIAEPRIYFGMTTNETIVTGSNGKEEFDYPTSTKDYNKNQYSGKAGINANFLDKCVLALKEKNIKLAISDSAFDNSKILMNRNIRDRAKTLMPYFIYDENPYLVVRDNGRLVWVLDAYTISNSYPYSQKSRIKVGDNYKEINYIRNSVKVIVDAYDGTIDFYITDRTDPIVMMYANLYPDLFKSKDFSIPNDIQKNIVYPEYLYNIQANMLERYHDVNTEIMYRSDDVWNVSKDQENNVNSTYTMVKTTDLNEGSLGLVTSYNKLNKQSLNSYLVGRYDDGNKLLIYKMAQDSNLPGIKQLQLQIEQDEIITEQLSKINTPGSKVESNIFIVPVENTVLYVEPIYQTMINEQSSVPTLKKVIVATGNKVAIGNDLEDAIVKLISNSAYDLGFINSDSEEELIEAIIKANNNLKDSSASDDWSMIGKDLSELQSLIDTLEDLRNNKDSGESGKSNLNKNSLFDMIFDSSKKTDN